MMSITKSDYSRLLISDGQTSYTFTFCSIYQTNEINF